MNLFELTLPPAWAGHPLVEKLGQVLLHFLWEGVLVAGVLAAALLLLRRRSAAARYAASLAALAVMAALPVVTWHALPPVAGGKSASPPGAEVPAAALPFAPEVRAPEVRAPGVRAPGASGSAVFALPPPAEAGALEAASNPEEKAGGVATLAAQVRRYADWSAPLVALTWLAGVAVLALRTAGGWGVALRMRRRATPPADRWQACFGALAREIVGRAAGPHAPQLLVSQRATGPATVGWWRPVVLVPAGFLAGLPPEQVEAILRHELAHVRRHDYLAGLFQAAVETLLFYHPAVWWVSGRVRTLREHCCDDVAVREAGKTGGKAGRLVYARALAALEDWRSAAPVAPAASGGGSLLARIRRVAEPGAAAPRASGPFAAVALAALVVLGVGVAGAAAGGAAPETAPKALTQNETGNARPAAQAPVPSAALRDTVPLRDTIPPRVVILSGRDTVRLGSDSLALDSLNAAPDAEAWRALSEYLEGEGRRMEAWSESWNPRRDSAWAERWKAWAGQQRAWVARWREEWTNAPEWQAWREEWQRWGDSLRVAGQSASPDSLAAFFQRGGAPTPPALPEGLLDSLPAPPASPTPPAAAYDSLFAAYDSLLESQAVRLDTVPQVLYVRDAAPRLFRLDSLRGPVTIDADSTFSPSEIGSIEVIKGNALRALVRPDTFPEGFAPEGVVRLTPKRQAAERAAGEREGNRRLRSAEQRALRRAARRLEARADTLEGAGRSEAARTLREEAGRLREEARRLREQAGLQRGRMQQRRERMENRRRETERLRERLERRSERSREEAAKGRAEAFRERAGRQRQQAEKLQEEVGELRERAEALRKSGGPAARVEALRRRANALEGRVLSLRKRSRQLQRMAGRLEREAEGEAEMQNIN